MLGSLEGKSHERRVPQYIAQLTLRDDALPVGAEGVGADDGGARAERDADVVLAEHVAHERVHLVVHEPHGDLRDLGGELLDLDAVELVHVHLHVGVDVEDALAAQEFLDDGELEDADLAVGDDEEVPAPAGGVEELQLGELFVELIKARDAGLALERLVLVELRPEVVEE